MAVPKYLKFAGAALAAALLAGGVIFATALAASPSPSPKASPKASAGRQAQAQAACDAFIGHVAKNLGKSTDQVKKALADATGQTIDDEVKNGTLTKAQGDQLKQKLAGRQVCSGPLAGIGRGGLHGHPGGPKRGAAAEATIMSDVAKALGITPAELKTDLQNGQTLQQIAASKGMDEAAFRKKLIATAKPDLDQAVAAGKITQAEEDQALQRLQNGPIPMWNIPVRRGMPKATPTPAS